MIDFAGLASKILKMFGLALISILCIFALHISYLSLVGSDLEPRILGELGISPAQSDSGDDRNSTFAYAISDNDTIREWVSHCAEIRGKNTSSSEGKDLFGPEIALMYMNQAIMQRRMYWDRRANYAFKKWQIATWSTIIIGMVTTIFVSLSTTEFGRGDGRSQRVVRTLAVVFPALGTAAAAVVGFYGPQAEWSQSSRSLASLSQLHGQMAIDIWKQQCILTTNDQNLSSVLDGWSKRYLDIETLSNTGGGSGSEPNGPAGSDGGASSQKSKS